MKGSWGVLAGLKFEDLVCARPKEPCPSLAGNVGVPNGSFYNSSGQLQVGSLRRGESIEGLYKAYKRMVYVQRGPCLGVPASPASRTLPYVGTLAFTGTHIKVPGNHGP